MRAASLIPELERLAAVLEARPPDPAHWPHAESPAAFLRGLARLAAEDEHRFWRELDSARLWAGIGSVANQALAPNPGLPEPDWAAQRAVLYEGLARIGRALRARAADRPVHPDLDAWLSVFEASSA